MQIKDIAPSYGIASLVALSVYYLKNLPINNWFILTLQIIIGAFALFVMCEMTKLQEYYEVKGIALEFFSSFRRHNSDRSIRI
jgi:hypothetical protein